MRHVYQYAPQHKQMNALNSLRKLDKDPQAKTTYTKAESEKIEVFCEKHQIEVTKVETQLLATSTMEELKAIDIDIRFDYDTLDKIEVQ